MHDTSRIKISSSKVTAFAKKGKIVNQIIDQFWNFQATPSKSFWLTIGFSQNTKYNHNNHTPRCHPIPTHHTPTARPEIISQGQSELALPKALVRRKANIEKEPLPQVSESQRRHPDRTTRRPEICYTVPPLGGPLQALVPWIISASVLGRMNDTEYRSTGVTARRSICNGEDAQRKK